MTGYIQSDPADCPAPVVVRGSEGPRCRTLSGVAVVFVILVDLLWPRGLRKDEAYFDQRRKEVSPTTSLREFYSYSRERFVELTDRYRDELRREDASTAIVDLARRRSSSSSMHPTR